MSRAKAPLFSIDLRGLDVEKRPVQKAGERLVHSLWVGDETIAHAKRALRRFDKAVDEIEVFRVRDPEPVEQRKDHERGQPLRRRRRIVERACADRDR